MAVGGRASIRPNIYQIVICSFAGSDRAVLSGDGT